MDHGSELEKPAIPDEPIDSSSREVVEGETFHITMLNFIAQCLPKNPPLTPGGELTVDDMCPNLSEEELAYVMTVYDGSMRRKVI